MAIVRHVVRGIVRCVVRSVTAGIGITPIADEIKALILAENLKLWALVETEAIDYTEEQLIGLTYNFEL